MKIKPLRLTVVFIINFLLLSQLQAQFNAEGIPFIKNYSPKAYVAGESNWAVTQDDRGIMYFGNMQSILEYDGNRWVKIPVPDQEYILSLSTGPDGDIYAGGIDDFGKLKVDAYGQMNYSSLADLIKDSIKLTRVWKIYSDSEFVYFCTFLHIIKYHPKTNQISTITLDSESNFWSFYLGNTLYMGNYDLGLLYLYEDKMQPVNGGDFYIKKDIFSMLPWSEDTLLIATKEIGLTFFNTKTGKVTPFNFNANAKKTNEILQTSSIYAGVKIDDHHFAYGTILGGLYVIDKKGSIKLNLDEATGLNNGTITNLFVSALDPGVLWLTGTNGMSTVNIQSPVRQFAHESGLNSAIYEITKYSNHYFVASMLGVFKLMQPAHAKSYFKAIEGMEGEMTYAILNFKTENGKEILLAGSDKDIYQIKDDKAYHLNLNMETSRLIQSKTKPNLIYAATSVGIKTIVYKNGVFVASDSILGIPKQYVTQIIEDKNGNLWCNMFLETELINSIGELQEMPQSIKKLNGLFFRYSDNICFSNEGNVFKYDYNAKDFKPCEPLNRMYHNKKKNIKELFPLNDSMVLANFLYNEKTANEIVVNNNGTWTNDSLTLRQIPSMTLNAAFYDRQYVLLGGQEGLFILNSERKKDFKKTYRSLIRTVTIGTDSVIYKGGKGLLEEARINGAYTLLYKQPIVYKFNNISFTYAASFFEKEEELQFKSRLVGFDRQWSNWQADASRTYTNLGEGTYQFQVKAINIYGIESEVAVFEFEILPPWHRTWWAFLIYLLIAFGILRISTKLYTRKLEEDKRKLEKIVKERTAEIVEKNAHIASQNTAITDSIRYAKRIQTAVLPNKQTSGLFDYFIYFKPKDIVSGDFYWIYHFEKQKRLIVVAADCTGHGVPGAFMSMLGTSFLNEIVSKLDVIQSDVILNLLRENVIRTLNQGMKENTKDEQKDGMDMTLVSIDLEKMVLEFSGANNPLIFIRNNELIEYKPDKMPIGAYIKQDIPFSRTEIKLQKDDVFYLFSDGFIDQFGGDKGRKYMKKGFKDLLLSIHQYPMDEQNKMINDEMIKWLVGHEQIDDQLVIGMKLLSDPSFSIITQK